MICIIHDNHDYCGMLQSQLRKRYQTTSINKSEFKIDRKNLDSQFVAFIFSFAHPDDDTISLITSTADVHQKTPIIINMAKALFLLEKYPLIKYVPINDISALLETIKSFGIIGINWDKLIPIVRQYISDNIHFLLKIKDVSERLGLREHDLSIQFEYREKILLKKFIENEKINYIKKTFMNYASGSFKSSSAALECGFKDEACLASFLKHQTGKTITEFYQDVLNRNRKQK